MIFHGSEDRAVPRDQGWEYYRALQQVGKAPVRFLWFPGQPHGLRKYTHRMRKMKEEIAWFDRYLFKTEEEKNTALKEGSPLALLLQQEKVQRRNGLFGVWQQDVLLPEVAPVDEDTIAIGLFEVTNAQYEFYAPTHSYDEGMANHPVSGLTTEQINGYLQWLSDKAGATYRLPNAKEGKALHKKALSAATSENTLNHWAGYTIPSNEVAELQRKVAEVKTTLLKPVGSFKASKVGKAKVYDLGGNVAEYYTDADALKTYGYSAYDFVDAANPNSTTAAQHSGFRVVRSK